MTSRENRAANTHKNKRFLDIMFPNLFSHDATPQHADAQEHLAIYNIEGREPFMLQGDVAGIYGVEVKKLNQARKRNPAKFQEGVHCFQLSEKEAEQLVTKCDRFKNLKHSSALPYGYTRRGAYMFATILQTPEATEQAIRIVEGFMSFEHALERQNGPAAPPLPAPTPKVELDAMEYQQWQADYWRTKYELERLQREKAEAEKKRRRKANPAPPYGIVEEAEIIACYRAGWSYSKIGTRMNPRRSGAAIRRKIYRLRLNGKI